MVSACVCGIEDGGREGVGLKGLGGTLGTGGVGDGGWGDERPC